MLCPTLLKRGTRLDSRGVAACSEALGTLQHPTRAPAATCAAPRGVRGHGSAVRGPILHDTACSPHTALINSLSAQGAVAVGDCSPLPPGKLERTPVMCAVLCGGLPAPARSEDTVSVLDAFILSVVRPLVLTPMAVIWVTWTHLRRMPLHAMERSRFPNARCSLEFQVINL